MTRRSELRKILCSAGLNAYCLKGRKMIYVKRNGTFDLEFNPSNYRHVICGTNRVYYDIAKILNIVAEYSLSLN
jgi:hypothetical protein